MLGSILGPSIYGKPITTGRSYLTVLLAQNCRFLVGTFVLIVVIWIFRWGLVFGILGLAIRVEEKVSDTAKGGPP